MKYTLLLIVVLLTACTPPPPKEPKAPREYQDAIQYTLDTSLKTAVFEFHPKGSPDTLCVLVVEWSAPELQCFKP